MKMVKFSTAVDSHLDYPTAGIRSAERWNFYGAERRNTDSAHGMMRDEETNC